MTNKRLQNESYYSSSAEQIINNLFSTTANGGFNNSTTIYSLGLEYEMDLKEFFEEHHINFIHLVHYFGYKYKDICPVLYYYYYNLLVKYDYNQNVFVYRELLEDDPEKVFSNLEKVFLYYDFDYSIIDTGQDKYVELLFVDKYNNEHSLKLYCMLDLLIFTFILNFMIGGDNIENDELR